MSNKIWRPPIIFGGRQSVGCTTLFYAYNISQKHRVTERLYLNFTAVSLFKTLPSLTLLANESKSRDGKNMIRWGERTAERVQVHQEKQKKEDFHVEVSQGNWTHPGGNDARGACGLSQRVTGDAAAR